MAFAIQASPAGRAVVLSVNGDVDIATAPTLRERLADAVGTYTGVVVDLDGVPFLDSTGLGVLVAAHNRAKSAGASLVIARPQRIVRNALRLVQVDTVIDVYDSVDDAVAAV
ncbi:MAG TPA: STAS domain-containing protein [Mycobacteriales bacterium]|jgi:anti-sigma B factor antagonist